MCEAAVDKANQQALERAIADHRAGRIDAAESAYRLVIANSPENSNAWHFLGLLLFQRHQLQPALDAMTQALSLAPGHAGIHANLGNMLLDLGQHEEAAQALERAITLDPCAVPPLIALSSLRKAQGRLVEAEAILYAALEQDADSAAVHHGMGNVQALFGRGERAVEHYRRALALDPQMVHLRKLMATELSRLGRPAEAALEYEAYLALYPDDPSARYLLAACRGGDADTTPRRADEDYVRHTFDGFAPAFDRILAGLGYRAPQLVAAALEQCLGEPRALLTALDVGCGTGLLGVLIRPWCLNLTGVDLSPGMLTQARAREVYQTLVEAELTAYLRATAPAALDVITCADTLCYFGTLDEVFAAAAPALRPGGWWIFTTEHAGAGSTAAGFELQAHGRYRHERDYVDRALESAGFDEVRIAEAALRLNHGEPVPGLIVAARVREAA